VEGISGSKTSENEALVRRAAEEIWVKLDASAVDRYVSESYIEHDPNLPGGREALRGIAASLASRPDWHFEVVRVVAQGDLVAVHGTGTFPAPTVSVDLFRVEGNQIVEHWDALQARAPANPSGHSMTDGTLPGESGGGGHAGALATGFIEHVLEQEEDDRIPEYVSADTFVQHNPILGDGIAALEGGIAAGQKNVGLRYSRLHRVIARGDFAVTQSEVLLAGKTFAMFDIWRVAEGRIIEHWDVRQALPATSANGNGMF
jgi:predicted SnoaL-like aldol condensation-catalyzing enzyme